MNRPQATITSSTIIVLRLTGADSSSAPIRSRLNGSKPGSVAARRRGAGLTMEGLTCRGLLAYPVAFAFSRSSIQGGSRWGHTSMKRRKGSSSAGHGRSSTMGKKGALSHWARGKECRAAGHEEELKRALASCRHPLHLQFRQYRGSSLYIVNGGVQV
jgi:hypothetical protein